MSESTLDQFQAHRERLFALAYRMLGVKAEAEDILQDAFLKWQQAAQKPVANPPALLTRIVTNLCIDALRSAYKKRQVYIGPWLPEPIETEPAGNPQSTLELADSLSMAFLRLLETLTPVERAVFLLREVFGSDYDEIAETVDTTPVNCRQIAHRARKRLHAETLPRFDASKSERDRLLHQFEQAIHAGDLESLKAALAEDITVYSDGGGKVHAARKAIHGITKVTKFIFGLKRKYYVGVEVIKTYINNEPGLIFHVAGKPTSAWSLHIEDGRIKNIFAVSNPDKLVNLEIND